MSRLKAAVDSTGAHIGACRSASSSPINLSWYSASIISLAQALLRQSIDGIRSRVLCRLTRRNFVDGEPGHTPGYVKLLLPPRQEGEQAILSIPAHCRFVPY